MLVLFCNSDTVMILHIFSSFAQEASSIGTFLAGPSHNHWQERPMYGRLEKKEKNWRSKTD